MMNQSSRPLAAVTGAFSGIGYVLAKQFAEHGYGLVNRADSVKIEEAARTLQEMGANVQSVQTDLATYEGVEKFYEAIRSEGRSLDAVAINAGVGVGGDFARETDLQAELKMVPLNVTSADTWRSAC
jgi:short-subunit dehydrogenase